MPSDIRAAKAREHHGLALEHDDKAQEHRRQRDELMRQLRREDPLTWTYLALAKAVGCSPELVAHICRGPGARSWKVSDVDPGDRL